MPVVETRFGKVRGKPSGGATAYLGVPYARAERFMPPRPPQPWPGVREAMGFGPSAPQSNPNPPAGPPDVIIARLPRPVGAPQSARPTEAEECQVLNVWTATSGHGEQRPVMVWLHGGFFSSSSGSTVDGSALAERHGVVVVSLNHRLNAFGFTDLSDFGSEFADSANVGMLDIVAALEWVRENIAAFGGDPQRVMLFGTSGGGMKTSVLMASPAARGLLQRAAVHSGPGLRFLSRSEASTATDLLLREAGLSTSNFRDLQTMPMNDLLGAYHRTASQLRPRRFDHIPCFGPVVDGRLLQRQPFAPDAAAGTGDIPLLIGSNDDEMTFFMNNDPEGFLLDEAGFERRVQDLSGDRAAEIAQHYRRTMADATPAERWIRFFSDYSVALPTLRQARRHAAVSNGKTWLYRLTLGSTALDGSLGATHTLETPLIFDTFESSPLLAGSPRAIAVAGFMSRAWTSFAAVGEPEVSEWQPLAADTGAMLFGEQSRFQPHFQQETLALLETAFPD